MPDLILIRNMTFVPTALIPKFNDGKEHIFYCRGIVLHRKASVTISIHPLSKNTYHARCCFSDRRIDDLMHFLNGFPVIYGD